jgi:hypothetical protein
MTTDTQYIIVVTTEHPPLPELLAELRGRGLRLRAGRDVQQPRYRTLDVYPPARADGLWPAIEWHFASLHELAEQQQENG